MLRWAACGLIQQGSAVPLPPFHDVRLVVPIFTGPLCVDVRIDPRSAWHRARHALPAWRSAPQLLWGKGGGEDKHRGIRERNRRSLLGTKIKKKREGEGGIAVKSVRLGPGRQGFESPHSLRHEARCLLAQPASQGCCGAEVSKRQNHVCHLKLLGGKRQ